MRLHNPSSVNARVRFQIVLVIVQLKLSSTQELREEDINFTLIYLTTGCFP